ncbi:hypothetical protein BDW22DRAFT_1473717 [Trametopsis cervina]|nr:hypothetical protein BDW22DRAFT_1473717 [Trametopsis cervina]
MTIKGSNVSQGALSSVGEQTGDAVPDDAPVRSDPSYARVSVATQSMDADDRPFEAFRAVKYVRAGVNAVEQVAFGAETDVQTYVSACRAMMPRNGNMIRAFTCRTRWLAWALHGTAVLFEQAIVGTCTHATRSCVWQREDTSSISGSTASSRDIKLALGKAL